MSRPRRTLVVAVTGRALFDMSRADTIYQKEGLQPYLAHMHAHRDELLEPGPAFHLVKALNRIRDPQSGEPMVSINLLSQNHALAGLRLLLSAREYGLELERTCFTGGASQVPYLSSMDVDLFLSFNEGDVGHALSQGIPSALFLSKWQPQADTEQVRIAFDGDSVLFSNESEAVYQEKGLEAFIAFEQQHLFEPLNAGPFKRVLECVNAIQRAFPPNRGPFRTALVTSRGTQQLLRPLMTLRSWEMEVDEAIGLDGYDKTGALEAFRPHIFFDDHPEHCERASSVATAARIPDALRNKEPKSHA